MNILVAVLICSSGVAPADCTVKTAEDVQYVQVPFGSCFGIGPQSVVAAQAGGRTDRMMLKIICGVRKGK